MPEEYAEDNSCTTITGQGLTVAAITSAEKHYNINC